MRKSQLSKVGYVTTGFYGGLALGRLVLAEPTYRFGERRMLLLYSVLCLALQLVFWRVKNVIADAAVVSCMGFLLGPYFATVSHTRIATGLVVVVRLQPNVCDVLNRV